MRNIQKSAGLLVVLLLSLNTMFANDIDTLYKRYWDIAINNPREAQIDGYLTLLKGDGSFSDIDYTSKTADLRAHLDRLKTFGGAYQSVGNAYYQDKKLKKKYYKSLQFWIETDHTPSNWWFRYIRYPKTFAPGLFLMNVELQAEMPDLFNDAISYLRWAYLQSADKPDFYMAGANGADQIYGTYPSSILTRNEAELLDYKQKIEALIVVQNKGEGIEVDWMYGQHSDAGRQVYANYEHEYLNSILTLLDLCRGSKYQVSDKELSILDKHFINGNQWYVYKHRQDPCQTGRKPSSMLNKRFPKTLNLLLGLNTPNNAQIEVVQDRILKGSKAVSQLTGNRMFWRFDYMIHRRANYYVSTRVTSTRTIGMESGNGEGNFNYYGGAGLNFIFRTGNEYDGKYFKVMNSRQWPGITVEQDDVALPLVDWGKGGGNGNAFAGGVSDGEYGAIGNIYDRRDVLAHKSWFYFEDEFVALGAGIVQSNGTAPVVTTINQSLQKGLISYSKSNAINTIELASGTTTVVNPDWFVQDSIGYANLQPSANYTISSDKRSGTNIFTLAIDHGVNPKDASYAYAVCPNASTEYMAAYKANLPFQIVSNTKEVQAVYHDSLKITQVIFYKPGSLVLANGKVLSVNAACAVMLKESTSKYQITVGNPLCETANPEFIELSINTKLVGSSIKWDGANSTIRMVLPQGDYAGQSVSIIAECE